MARIKYKNINIGGARLAMVEQVNRIVREYRAQGYILSLRQIFYQFVSRGWIVNKQTEYKRLGDIVSDGRMAGMIDWEAVEDRTRELDGNTHWSDPSDIIEATARSYMIDKWAGQKYRPEVWVEKDALEGVIGRTAKSLDIDFFSCRGYTSQTAMHRAAQRMKATMARGQRPVILHFGDHDPSGLDMTRDIRERLNEFAMIDWLNEEMNLKTGVTVKVRDILKSMEDRCGFSGIEVRRLALTMDQITEYNPPPNPAKTTDARYAKYQEEYGDESWELDALEPSVLDQLIRGEVDELREPAKFNKLAERERRERALLKQTSARWDEVAEFIDTNIGIDEQEEEEEPEDTEEEQGELTDGPEAPHAPNDDEEWEIETPD